MHGTELAVIIAIIDLAVNGSSCIPPGDREEKSLSVQCKTDCGWRGELTTSLDQWKIM